MVETTGFVSRTKGKMKVHQLYLGAGGLVLSAKGTPVQSTPVWSNAGAPSNGTSGTLFGVANPGDLLVDSTNKVLYQNSNTLASPTWTALTTATGAGTYTGNFDGIIGANAPADGAFTTAEFSGIITNSVATGLVASVTQTQVGALALTKQWNNIATCAHSADAVKLPALTAGQWCVIFNSGANPAAVWPATSGNIDGAGANTAVTLTNAKRALYLCLATNVIISAQLGVASA